MRAEHVNRDYFLDPLIGPLGFTTYEVIMNRSRVFSSHDSVTQIRARFYAGLITEALCALWLLEVAPLTSPDVSPPPTPSWCLSGQQHLTVQTMPGTGLQLATTAGQPTLQVDQTLTLELPSQPGEKKRRMACTCPNCKDADKRCVCCSCVCLCGVLSLDSYPSVSWSQARRGGEEETHLPRPRV